MGKKKPVTDAEILAAFKRYFDKNIGMNSLADSLELPLKVFRTRLRHLYKKGSIVMKFPENEDLANTLRHCWPDVSYRVLNAVGDNFYQGAAEVFFDVLKELLLKRPKAKPLHIGIVSGRTTGGMIESICNIGRKWSDLIPLDQFPSEIYIYALNVSQINGYNHLKGNANVLTYLLAHSFTSEVKQSKVEAYGLSATLLQTKKEVQRSDCTTETRFVLKDIDPKRLAESLAAQGKGPDQKLPAKSLLDIVITGVGSIQDSLFKDYSESNNLDVHKLQYQEQVVGDIAYCPVTRVGEPRELMNKDNEVCEFYRAISLEVLQEMSSDTKKRVIVVARNNPTNQSRKTDIIHAAIAAEDAKYCNVLITDEGTAKDLHRRLAPVED